MRAWMALVVVLLASCGSAPRHDSYSTNPVPASTGPISQPGPAAVKTTPPGVTPAATVTRSPSGQPKVPVAVRLDVACARAGLDTQGLTVDGADRGGPVGYSTEYSDHSNEFTNKTYKDGFGYGKADPNGHYRATWTVPATAPSGKAVVHVITSADPKRSPPVEVSFSVARADGKC